MRDLPLFVEVDQFLVQQPIEQFEILQTFRDIAVFPEPILSSADVVQHILDFAAAKRVPRVVLDDSVRYASRTVAHLASILPLLLSLPNVLAAPQELDMFPGKIEMTVPSVFEKIAHLYLHNNSCAPHHSLPKHRQYFALCTKQITSRRFALTIQSFLCSLCDQLHSFWRPRTAGDTKDTYWDTVVVNDLLQDTVSDGDLEHSA